MFTARKGFIDDLPVASVEKAFGLKSGDIKLIDDPACQNLIEHNSWTKHKYTLGKMIRFEAIRESVFNTQLGKQTVATGTPIIDFLSGRKYTENVVLGAFVDKPMHADYLMVGYVNENVRLLKVIMPGEKKDKKVCKVSDKIILWKKITFFYDYPSLTIFP